MLTNEAIMRFQDLDAAACGPIDPLLRRLARQRTGGDDLRAAFDTDELVRLTRLLVSARAARGREARVKAA